MMCFSVSLAMCPECALRFQVDDDASFDEVKAAYRSLTKVCHPDFTGDAGHNLCVMLNEVRYNQ